MNETPSNEYLARLAASEQAATDHFVEHYSKVLRIKLRARKVASSEIDEISQETFRRVFSAVKRGAIRDGASINAFVNSTCNNVILEHFRRLGRFAPLDPAVGWPSQDDTEKEALRSEDVERIRHTLSKLPERDQQILTALFLEELDKDAICRMLGVDRDYLRVLLHRAKESFRQGFNS